MVPQEKIRYFNLYHNNHQFPAQHGSNNNFPQFQSYNNFKFIKVRSTLCFGSCMHRMKCGHVHPDEIVYLFQRKKNARCVSQNEFLKPNNLGCKRELNNLNPFACFPNEGQRQNDTLLECVWGSYLATIAMRDNHKVGMRIILPSPEVFLTCTIISTYGAHDVTSLVGDVSNVYLPNNVAILIQTRHNPTHKTICSIESRHSKDKLCRNKSKQENLDNDALHLLKFFYLLLIPRSFLVVTMNQLAQFFIYAIYIYRQI